MEKVITRINATHDDWSQKEWLENGAKWWKASAARVVNCDHLYVLDAQNIVRAVGQIEGVLKDLDSGSGRISIIYRPVENSEWIGKEIRRWESRNPIVYLSTIESAQDKE